MQIHELTQSAMLSEAGLWDTLKAAISNDPKLAGMTVQQKAQYMANNAAVDKIAERALSTWNVYVAQRSKTTPTFRNDQNKYRTELKLFVEKNLLPAYGKVDQSTLKSELNTAINDVTAKRNNLLDLQKPFNRLVDLAAVSQTDPRTQANKPPGGTRTPPQRPAQQTAPTGALTSSQAVVQVLGQFGMSPQAAAGLGQILQQTGGTTAVRATGNASVDSVLRTMGFNITP